MVKMGADESKCPICGRVFIKPPMSVYKLNIKGKTKYYCRYNCFRVDQKKLERSGKK